MTTGTCSVKGLLGVCSFGAYQTVAKGPNLFHFQSYGVKDKVLLDHPPLAEGELKLPLVGWQWSPYI
jgi:hypothetical protein